MGMRILHTADWHLGDRLKHIDRTADLTRAVAKVAEYCETKEVDVLLIAGDLISDVTRSDTCAAALAMLNDSFRPFLLRGGTIVAIAGNHDGDRFCEIVCRTSQLAAPLGARQGDVLPNGRWYFATRPCHFRLLDSADASCHFACLPYPNSVRYRLDEESTLVNSRDKHELLASAFRKHAIRLRSKTRAGEPSVLAAHVAASGANWGDLFRMSEREDIVIRDESLWKGWDYVALGHLHRPQLVGGNSFVRYSGSIERLDIGERDDQKGVILVELAPGRAPDPQFLRLDATPFYDVQIRHPGRELPLLRSRFPQADQGWSDVTSSFLLTTTTFPAFFRRYLAFSPVVMNGVGRVMPANQRLPRPRMSRKTARLQLGARPFVRHTTSRLRLEAYAKCSRVFCCKKYLKEIQILQNCWLCSMRCWRKVNDSRADLCGGIPLLPRTTGTSLPRLFVVAVGRP